MRTTQEEMIERQLERKGVTDRRVLCAMRAVDRSLFVPDEIKDLTYTDQALPIGHGQTISQPYIVGYMAQVLELKPDDVVLEIGTGCGYNAAVLSHLVSHVHSMEVVDRLAIEARQNLDRAGIGNVTIRHGDGYAGWPEEAPFDAIVLTAAPTRIPGPLKEQLKVGGKLLAPVGEGMQYLILIERTGADNYKERTLAPVVFVPMTGEAQQRARSKD